MATTVLADGPLNGMGLGDAIMLRAMYVGEAVSKGVTQPIRPNLMNLRIDRGKFARWGDGLEYHIGYLGHTVFGWPARRQPRQKYRRWADALFETVDPPRLRHPTTLYHLRLRTTSRGPSGLLASLPAADKESSRSPACSTSTTRRGALVQTIRWRRYAAARERQWRAQGLANGKRGDIASNRRDEQELECAAAVVGQAALALGIECPMRWNGKRVVWVLPGHFSAPAKRLRAEHPPATRRAAT